jgi:hypothetical protein
MYRASAIPHGLSISSKPSFMRRKDGVHPRSGLSSCVVRRCIQAFDRAESGVAGVCSPRVASRIAIAYLAGLVRTPGSSLFGPVPEVRSIAGRSARRSPRRPATGNEC